MSKRLEEIWEISDLKQSKLGLEKQIQFEFMEMGVRGYSMYRKEHWKRQGLRKSWDFVRRELSSKDIPRFPETSFNGGNTTPPSVMDKTGIAASLPPAGGLSRPTLATVHNAFEGQSRVFENVQRKRITTGNH